MDPHDDPEARIRALEDELSTRASELGTGPGSGHSFAPTSPWPSHGGQFPAPAPPNQGARGRIVLVLAAGTAFLVAGGISAYLMFTGSDRSGEVTGGVFDSEPSSHPTRTVRKPTPTALPPVLPSQSAPDETVIVTGISEHRRIECTDNTVTVAGIENTLTITGHCSSLAISGIRHHITVESVDNIVVSGINNRVIFHTGEPQVANSGQSNVIERG